MATTALAEKNGLPGAHNSPNNLDEKLDPASLRQEKRLAVDAIPDPDAGLSDEERAARVI